MNRLVSRVLSKYTRFSTEIAIPKHTVFPFISIARLPTESYRLDPRIIQLGCEKTSNRNGYWKR